MGVALKYSDLAAKFFSLSISERIISRGFGGLSVGSLNSLWLIKFMVGHLVAEILIVVPG